MSSESNTQSTEMPEEFPKLLSSMINDIRLVFPEYAPLIAKWWKEKEQYNYIEEEADRNAAFAKAEAKCLAKLFDFCKRKYPPRFFDILYSCETMFAEDSDVDTEFLPQIHFRSLWNDPNISEKTRETIWKYLQLVLFSVVGTMESKDGFGDTAKLFEAVDEGEFKSKLQDTLAQIQELFEKAETGEEGTPQSETTTPPIDPEQMHEHLSSMLGGKIGQLAQEIASETAQDFNLNMDEGGDVKEVFAKLLRNPTRLMGIVQKIGTRLDEKIKAGDIKESELIAETTELLGRMKDMPGMGGLFSGMGLGNKTKVNVNAMEAQLNQRMKMAKMKERMRSKVESKREAKEAEAASAANANVAAAPVLSEEEMNKKMEELYQLFAESEKPQKTPRKPAAAAATSATNPPVGKEKAPTSSGKPKGKGKK